MLGVITFKEAIMKCSINRQCCICYRSVGAVHLCAHWLPVFSAAAGPPHCHPVAQVSGPGAICAK